MGRGLVDYRRWFGASPVTDDRFCFGISSVTVDGLGASSVKHDGFGV